MTINITATKIEFMHGECDNWKCPICRRGSVWEYNDWINERLTVVKTGFPRSPWWVVEEETGDCYRKLRGNKRLPGFYDR